MNREEAISQLKNLYEHCKSMDDGEEDSIWCRDCEAIQLAISVLSSPTHEQMKWVFGGIWEGSADGYYNGELVYDMWECSRCGYEITDEDDPDMLPDFCPKCGAANTKKALEIIKERWGQ